MNIKSIKIYIEGLKDKKIKVKVNVGRNKYELYKGCIDKLYPYLFTIKTNGIIKSFSYVDVLIKNVIITTI